MLRKYLFYLLLLLLTSCISKSILQNGGKYYYEVNIYEYDKNKVRLTQDVIFNHIRDGLHSSSNSLTIEFMNKSMIAENEVFIINNNISKIKVNYIFNSNRTWDLKAKNIKGKIKILEIKDDFIKLKENIIVIDKNNEIIKYYGIRIFRKAKGNEHNYRKMSKNGKKLWFTNNNLHNGS